MVVLEKAVNIKDRQYFNKLYVITFYISNAINPVYYIYGYCEQSALDTLIDFLNDIGKNIYTLNDEEINDLEEYEMDDYICVGNYCEPLGIHTFNISEVEKI